MTINYWTIRAGNNFYLLPKTKEEIERLKDSKMKEKHKETELRNMGLKIEYVRDNSLLDDGELYDSVIRISGLASLLIQNFDNMPFFKEINELITTKSILNYHDYLWGIIFSFRNIEELAKKMADDLGLISDFTGFLSTSIVVNDLDELREKMNGKMFEPVN